MVKSLILGSKFRYFFYISVVWVLLISNSVAQTMQDSGWANLIKPDFEGLYSFLKGRGMDSSVHRNVFSITPQNEIYCDVDSGHVGTLKKYSHYRMRVQFKFGTRGPGAWGTNAGIMYHIDEEGPYMEHNGDPWWPQSIEAQVLTSEVGAVYSISGVTFDLYRRPGGNTYQPQSQGGELATCPDVSRSFRPSKNNYNGAGNWTDYEIVIRGSDKGEHWIMGEEVMEIMNIRLRNGNAWRAYDNGHIALQAEVKEIWYRNWHIMELHPDGPDRMPILDIDTNKTTGFSLGDNPIHWNTSGQVDSIKVEFNNGTTNNPDWKILTTDATSPFSINANNFNPINDSVEIKISAWDGIVSDIEKFRMDWIGPVKLKQFGPGFKFFGPQGLIKNFTTGTFTKLNVYNPRGKLIQNLFSKKHSFTWDGKDFQGKKVSSGWYFIEAIGPSGKQNFKINFSPGG